MKALTCFVHLCAALTALPLLAADWQTWSDCQYVADPANRGDSFRIRAGGNDQVVRLYSVTCSVEHFGLTKALTRKTADDAAAFTRQQLADKSFTVVTRNHPAGQSGAVYAYVVVGKQDLGRALVAHGLAHEAGPRASRPDASALSYVAALRDAEQEARRAGRGGWAYRKSRATPVNLQRDTGHRLSRPAEIRHNSSCRHYHLKNNAPCAPADGSPCKVCGG